MVVKEFLGHLIYMFRFNLIEMVNNSGCYHMTSALFTSHVPFDMSKNSQC